MSGLEVAKVVRIWRTEIDPARADEYEEFARTRSVPMFRAQPGFVAVLFASHGAERAVITFWEDWDAADALGASESYEATVKEIEAAGFLRGEQSVEAFALDASFGRSADERRDELGP
jgi:heme-degrading monooxygenase HmoA